jgi:hypothetical protein
MQHSDVSGAPTGLIPTTSSIPTQTEVSKAKSEGSTYLGGIFAYMRGNSTLPESTSTLKDKDTENLGLEINLLGQAENVNQLINGSEKPNGGTPDTNDSDTNSSETNASNTDPSQSKPGFMGRLFGIGSSPSATPARIIEGTQEQDTSVDNTNNSNDGTPSATESTTSTTEAIKTELESPAVKVTQPNQGIIGRLFGGGSSTAASKSPAENESKEQNEPNQDLFKSAYVIENENGEPKDRVSEKKAETPEANNPEGSSVPTTPPIPPRATWVHVAVLGGVLLTIGTIVKKTIDFYPNGRLANCWAKVTALSPTIGTKRPALMAGALFGVLICARILIFRNPKA